MIAVIAARMMKMTLDEVVNMIAMRNSLVTAAFPMLVVCVVAAASVSLRAVVGVSSGDSEDMFVDMLTMRRVKVAIMEIIDVVRMPDRCMAATGAVLVGMVLMGRMGTAHDLVSFREA